MKVTGFTFIRNAIAYDYPIVEAITSILPLCTEFVVAVGNSSDDTLALIESIHSPKIRIINTTWDDSLREGGVVLAKETDKAFAEIATDSDWAFYIQGDEVIHEKFHPIILSAMERWKTNPAVDGLLFNYLHFYGSYDYLGASSKWYDKEIRVIRSSKNIYSYRDAQGFRKNNNEKLRVKLIDAYVYHYGWVKDPRAMQQKQQTFQKLWHSDEWVDKNVLKAEEFDYSHIDALHLFTGTHPTVMKHRIKTKNWQFSKDLSHNKISLKDRFKKLLSAYFGIHIGYKNYKII